MTDSFELEDGKYQIYVALNTQNIIDTSEIELNGVPFERQPQPIKLTQKKIPNVYTFDSPAGLLLENELFKKYVKEHNLDIDLTDFEKRKFYIDSKAMRLTIMDGDFNITFEELEGLINYLDEIFGEDRMPLCKEVIRQIEQNV